MTKEELEAEAMAAIKEHFDNIDKLCEVLEKIVTRLEDMDLRIRTLEMMLPKKKDDGKEAEPVLA